MKKKIQNSKGEKVQNKKYLFFKGIKYEALIKASIQRIV